MTLKELVLNFRGEAKENIVGYIVPIFLQIDFV